MKKHLKQLMGMLLAVMMVMSMLTIGASAAELAFDISLTGNTGAIIKVSGGISSAVSQDTSVATVSQNGSTLTVNAADGAVGIATITVNGEYDIEIPVGYTTFSFNGDTLTVTEGNSTNYTVTGINTANEEYAVGDELFPLPEEIGADGSRIYKNTDAYKLSANIAKKGGTFVFTGQTNDMSIAVKKAATAPAVILLAGLKIKSSFTAPITVKKESTSTVTITALGGYTNTIEDAPFNNADVYGLPEDGGNNTNPEYAESSCIKGKANSDITINGKGVIDLICTTKNAIKVNEFGKLTIDGATINITSAKHGISCDNLLEIKSGVINITSAEDGMRTNPDAVDAELGCAGNIVISGGEININAQSDGIQAAQNLTITGGDINIKTLGGYSDRTFNKDTMSCKGLKASNNSDENADTSESTNTIDISGGTIALNTADDAIHSDGYVVITGGKFTIQTGDDGVHADTSATFGKQGDNDKLIDLTVVTSYEGLEAGNLYFYSGTYNVRSTDDGINAAGNTTQGFNPGGGPGRPGQGGWGQSGGSSTTSKSYSINVYGGNIYMNADGDGFDSNGNLSFYGGKSVVFGMKSGGDNNPLDCDGTLLIQNGYVFAAGSSSMRTTPSSASQKYITSTSSVASGRTVCVKYNGTTVFSIVTPKALNYVLWSSPDMASSTGWTISNDTSAAIGWGEEEEDPCANGHSWDNGTLTKAATCLETGSMLYKCLFCDETKTETIKALGHDYVNGYCSRCGEEDPDAVWYTATFAAGEGSVVTTYLTQDITAPYETGAETALARNSDTGKKAIDGDGQVNFSVAADEGYEIVSVAVTDGTANYKNLKVVDEANHVYRVTKITGDLTITVTTEKVQPAAPEFGITADKEEYLINEEITLTVKTPADAVKVGIFNESGKGITQVRSSNTVDGETKIWTIVIKIGTKGERSISAKAIAAGQTYADVEYLGNADINVVKEIAPKPEDNEPKIIAGTISIPSSAKVKTPFTITLRTTKAVTNIGIFNENGSGITCTKSYADSSDYREWTIQLSVGTAGSRSFSIGVKGAEDTWINSGYTVTMQIVK